MKILSNIKPRKLPVRRVEVNGTLYVFENRGDGEYEADVANPADAEIFLRSPHFRRADGKSVLRHPEPGEGAQAAKPAEEGGEPESKPDAAIDAEAEALLANTASDIGKELGGVSSLAVVERAIELEAAGKNRANVHTLLTKTLEGARQAGVA